MLEAMICAVVGAAIALFGFAAGTRFGKPNHATEKPKEPELTEAERKELDRAKDIIRQYNNLMAYDGRPQSDE